MPDYSMTPGQPRVSISVTALFAWLRDLFDACV